MQHLEKEIITSFCNFYMNKSYSIRMSECYWPDIDIEYQWLRQ